MITKNILQIAGISLFFFLIGFFLTYPYELSYNGNEKVVLLEDSYDDTSLEALINKKEFHGKVLYIRIWEPFDPESRSYTEEERKVFQKQLEDLKDDSTSAAYQSLLWKVEGRTVKSLSVQKQLDAIESVAQKFDNKEVAFVFITDPDSNFKSRKDDLRKWKKAVKKFQTPGYHLILNPQMAKYLRQHFNKTRGRGVLPHYLLADKRRKVIEHQVPWPQDTALLYSRINQLLSH
jgi:hypothetical protein